MVGTSAAFESGSRIGAQAAADADEAQANLVKQQEIDRARLAATQAEQDAETSRAKLANTVKSNDELFKTLQTSLTGKVAENRTALDSQTYDTDTQNRLKQNLDHDTQLLSNLEIARQQNLQNNPSGQHSYDPSYYTAPGAPSNMTLSEQAKQRASGEAASAYYNGIKAQNDVLNPGWNKTDKVDPEKIAPKAEDARDAFGNGVDQLPTAAQRVVDAKRQLDANPNDTATLANYKIAVEGLQKTRDGLQQSWSGVVDRVQDGGMGKLAQQAYSELAPQLPPGMDPTVVSNHALLQQKVNGILAPLAEKQRKQGLTPAESAIALRYSKLADALHLDKDVSGALQASTFDGNQPAQQGRDMQNLKGNALPLPVNGVTGATNTAPGGVK